MVRQFDEFFSPSFWRVFDAWPKCVPDAYLLVVLHPNRVRPHKEPLHQQRRLEAARRLSFTKGKKPVFWSEYMDSTQNCKAMVFCYQNCSDLL